ncbi:hypothetical protein AQPE_1726 [Aquipluma nitroreducens]|uniref:Uncharacterized protein n=1 Tax=Aquipluma nitroreducens TaxID=2010828 RepID=A0A5K7S7S1_9BACT|nr:hypothetical protein AQPE_1726 [Aquipluma nitroreducens]
MIFLAHNPKAVGSSPAPATTKALAFYAEAFLCPFVNYFRKK